MKLINLPAIVLIELPPTEIDRNNLLAPGVVDAAIWSEFLALQISPATRKSYAASLKDFFRRQFDLAVTPSAIEYFLSCSESDALGYVLVYRGQLLAAGLAAGTINARLAALKSFVNHAARRKLCDFRLNDIRAVKAQTYKDTRGVSIDQFQDLIDTLDRDTPLGCRNYAILRLLWDNGLRRGEVCGLDRADFRSGEARLMLRGKGRIDKEPLDLAPVTVDAIADWLTVAADWQSSRGLAQAELALFLSSRNTRLSASQLYKMVRELAESADSIERVISPHRVRHSSITALLDLNGGNLRAAQAHSRHKDVSTLIRYDDNRQELQGKSARTLADAIVARRRASFNE